MHIWVCSTGKLQAKSLIEECIYNNHQEVYLHCSLPNTVLQLGAPLWPSAQACSISAGLPHLPVSPSGRPWFWRR